MQEVSRAPESFPVVFSDVFGDPNIGVFSYANDKVAVLPAGISRKKLKTYKEALNLEPFSIGLGESRLVGIYLAGNSNGLLIPHIASDKERGSLEESGLAVHVLHDRFTALGNLIVCNDYGAVVDPRFRPGTIQAIEESLRVPVAKGSMAGLPNVGALAVASNKGVLLSPLANNDEKTFFSNSLGVPAETGTVNSGVPFPKAGVVANSNGAVVGSMTMGNELIAVSNVFQGNQD